MKDKHIIIDGSEGEGGGQILRSALSLSMITGKAVTLKNIRAGRQKPGLMRQHLTCVKAAAEICAGDVSPVFVGTTELTFTPGKIKAGDYHFAIGTAGSTTLVAQTILPALMQADSASTMVLEGGTHNMKCPPFDFIERAFLPVLKKMGADISCTLDRYGFFPAGGGQMSFQVNPAASLKHLDLTQRGKVKSTSAGAYFANISHKIAERELKVVGKRLGWDEDQLHLREVKSISGGNILLLTIVSEHITECFAGFGVLGISAEAVAKGACKNAARYINSEAVIGPYLADQLLLPMAIAGGGKFTTLRPSLHLKTNIEVIQKFLDIDIKLEEIKPGLWQVAIG